jgi:acetoin utilization deacetylase AcuC-like enzyme
MRIYHTDHFEVPLPPGHRFPIAKYRLLRERVIATGVVRPNALAVPEAAADGELRLVHSDHYICDVTCGTLDAAGLRRLGLPWSPELVERSRRSVGATIAAARWAVGHGIGMTLAGGTHHAFTDRGEGFCVFNDVAVAVRVLQRDGTIRRALVIDTDVHQGNGTARIFRDDSSVFTFDIHGSDNFPFHKEPADLDVALPDGTGDDEYLRALRNGLARIPDPTAFDLVFYLAGADPFGGDRLGRLALTKTGLAERDRAVFVFCREHGLPVAVAMAGGYAADIADTVDIHAGVVRAAGILAQQKGERGGAAPA